MNITKLIFEKLQGNLSNKEEEFFEKWIQEDEENKLLFSRIEALKNKGVDISEVLNLDMQSAWNIVKQEAEGEKKRSIVRTNVWRYAAILVCLLSATYAYWNYTTAVKNVVEINEDVITLELGNGEIEEFLAGESKMIRDASGNVLGKRQGEEIDYSNAELNETLVYNTLHIPNGKRFKVVLSDGSIVHLNAGSSLKYPAKFLKNEERHVFLKGEAYFDIREDKAQAFIVSSNDMNVRVLGTQFNVTSYEEDEYINTVLVEGSVQLYAGTELYDESKSVLLKPGYKATWEKFDKSMELSKVNTQIYTGWLNGKLVMKKMPFKDILQKMQRFYNMKIINEYSALDTRKFTATFDVETIQEAFDVFAEDTYFTYTVTDDTITIHKPNNSK